MKKLRIAFLVSVFPSVSETFIVNQITDLIDRGHEVKIFAFERGNDGIVHQKIISYGLVEKTVYFQDLHVSKLKRYFPFFRFIISQPESLDRKRLLTNFPVRKHGLKAMNLQFFYRLKWILDEGYFDIFHAHFGVNGAYLGEIKKKGFLKATKLVTSFHGYDLAPKLLSQYREKYKYLFEEADLLTVNTWYTKKILRQITQFKNMEILPVGLDTSEFNPGNIKEDKFQLLFVGRLVPFKAPNLAIDIVRSIILKGYRNIKLTIIGEGELMEDLIEYVGQYKLEAYVEIKGALSQEDVINAMGKADVFIMPGIYDKNGRAENQGLVIQEAQAMELPVVISNAGGMKYGVIDGKTGFVVKEKDVEGFVEKIEIFLSNRELAKGMGKRGREFVIKNYDSRVLGDRLEKLYSKVLS